MKHSIIIDGTSISHKKISIFDSSGIPIEVTNPVSSTETGGSFNPRRKAEFSIESDTYMIFVQSGVFMTIKFSIDEVGNIQYDNQFENVFSGKGTNELILKGFQVQFDFQSIISGGVFIPSVMGNDNDTDTEWTTQANYRLLPANGYALIAGSGLVADFSFHISNDGILTSDTTGNYFKIEANNKLTITGYPTIIDAQSINYTQFWLNINNVPPTTNGIITGNLIPLRFPSTYSMGAYITDDPSAYVNISHQQFSVMPDGSLEVNDPSTLKAEGDNGNRKVTLLKRLSQLISSITISKNECQVGESVKIEVQTLNPLATVKVNGIYGSSHFLQFNTTGKKTISIIASFDNYFEESNIDLNVVPFSEFANLKAFPILQQSMISGDSYNPLFSIPSEVFNQPNFSAHWDFGDGTSLVTNNFTVNHDFESVLDADTENYTFDIKCTISQENQPDVFVARTLYIHNIYARCKKLGTIIAKTNNQIIPVKNGDSWGGVITINNIETENISFDSFYLESMEDNETEQEGILESLVNPLVVPANSIVEYPISIAQDKLVPNSIGFSIILIGKHANGLPVRSESFFEFPFQIAQQNLLLRQPFNLLGNLDLRSVQFADIIIAQPPMEGAECDPDNSPDEVTDNGDSNWACQSTTEVRLEEVKAKFINARKGDIILSPGGPSGIIGKLLYSVTPPQYYSHCGIMTRNYDQITHCTMSDSRMNDYPNGAMDQPTDGFRPDVLKYGWPGVITQVVQNTIDGEEFTDPETNKKYRIGAFPGDTSGIKIDDEVNPVFKKDGQWLIIPAMVIKPDPLLELRDREVRKKLHKVANEALNQTGKCHYRFYSYTDGTISNDVSKLGPANSGWAAGTFPAVCSTFVWYCIKKLNFNIESRNSIVTDSDLELSDKASYNGGEVNQNTKDGLYLYRADERLRAAIQLSESVKKKIQEQIDEIKITNDAALIGGLGGTILGGIGGGLTLGFLGAVIGELAPEAIAWITDIKDDISNQVVNAFNSDWCDTDAKDSENWKNQIDSNSVSPDNMIMWDSPLNDGLYGYATPLVVRPKRTENVIVHRWKKTLLRGTLRGNVTFNGHVQSGVFIELFDGKTTISNENGEYSIEQIPVGNYELKATFTHEGLLATSNLTVNVLESQNTLDVTLRGPSGNFRKLIVKANIKVVSDDTDDNGHIENPVNDRDIFHEFFLDFQNSRQVSKEFNKTQGNNTGKLTVIANINFDRSIHVHAEVGIVEDDEIDNIQSFDLIVPVNADGTMPLQRSKHIPTLGHDSWTEIFVTFSNVINPVD